jgi:hypothetical protein
VSGRANAYREEHGTRRKGKHVSLMVQAENVHEVCMWSARVGATHVMSGDASRARDGACSRGSLRNDGLVRKRMIVEDDCDDNYLAELAANLFFCRWTKVVSPLLAKLPGCPPCWQPS